MRRAVLIALLTAAPAAPAQPPQGDAQDAPIVVTGIRIQDYRDSLARCLARNCPTNEDADATLALAEALFLNGFYRDARTALRASLRRNADEARIHPEPVSDLYRAHARVSRHLGWDQDARRSTYDILNALQAGIAREDHRHFTARLEISEVLMLAGNLASARRNLAALARAARDAGREDVATIAELRILWFETIAHPEGSARPRLNEIAASTAPADRMRATGAKLILSRLYRDAGDTGRADALIAEIGRGLAGGARRRLLHSPAYQLQAHEPPGFDPGDATSYVSTLRRTSDNFEDKWIDVGFWVLPGGRVAGLEILRQSRRADWAGPLLASIRGRTYSPGPEASYRIERYTYTSGYVFDSGSRIVRRSGRARAEYLDLTTGETPSVPPPPPTAD